MCKPVTLSITVLLMSTAVGLNRTAAVKRQGDVERGTTPIKVFFTKLRFFGETVLFIYLIQQIQFPYVQTEAFFGHTVLP